MWYSNNDQSWADVKLARTLEVPAGGDVRFWLWDNYDIEELWDYGFVEVSTNGGSTGGEWRHDYVDLTPYAGSTIGLRLRYATDAGFEAPGWFADDFEVTADGTSVLTDDVEGGAAGWTAEQGTFTDTSGAGWIITSGTFIYQHYHLAEWRNYDGFDKGPALRLRHHLLRPLRRSGEAAAHDPTTLKNLPSRAQSSNALTP